MLRIYCLQLWWNLSDPAMEEELHERLLYRGFAGLDGATRVLCECTQSQQRQKTGLTIQSHSHSIVAGGLLLTSYVTRLMPRTSLMMRPDTFLSRAYGSSAQSAVMKSLVCTARRATT